MASKDKYRIKKRVNAFKCLRCNHEWIPRVNLEQLEGEVKKKPRICPKCKNAYWDLERKNKINKEKKE